ncbi:unnamed protein product, partial [Amoebophrya sp. A120]|eukprot:GSA120T00021968001.1
MSKRIIPTSGAKPPGTMLSSAAQRRLSPTGASAVAGRATPQLKSDRIKTSAATTGAMPTSTRPGRGGAARTSPGSSARGVATSQPVVSSATIRTAKRTATAAPGGGPTSSSSSSFTRPRTIAGPAGTTSSSRTTGSNSQRSRPGGRVGLSKKKPPANRGNPNQQQRSGAGNIKSASTEDEQLPADLIKYTT